MYTVGNDTAILSCGWPVKNTGLRFSSSGLAAITGLSLVIFNIARPGIWGARISLMILVAGLGSQALGMVRIVCVNVVMPASLSQPMNAWPVF
jgi:hypothetical protein